MSYSVGFGINRAVPSWHDEVPSTKRPLAYFWGRWVNSSSVFCMSGHVESGSHGFLVSRGVMYSFGGFLVLTDQNLCPLANTIFYVSREFKCGNNVCSLRIDFLSISLSPLVISTPLNVLIANQLIWNQIYYDIVFSEFLLCVTKRISFYCAISFSFHLGKQ